MSNKTFTVYFHTNIDFVVVYVGITSQKPENRWGYNGKNYLQKKKNGEFVQPKFARAILAYGWENFSHDIFAEGVSKADACLMEMALIALYDSINNGYNITKGGEGTIGVIISTDERERRSKLYKGRHLSPDTEFKKGHTFSEETLKKMSEIKLGKTSWNKGLIGYLSGDKNPMKRKEVVEKFKGSNNPSSKSVVQLTREGEFIRVWDYMSLIQETLGFNISNISKCCRGFIKSAYGYKWEYA